MSLSADLHRPVTDQRVPVLVTVQPYRKDLGGADGYVSAAEWFAERGYASLLVDLLGTGASDGVRRPEFDPHDADDAIAAIDWAAQQSWCTGTAGAWGMSYAANTTFRAASRQPPRLRAIVALDHGLDPGRDSVHPDGARGDLHALVNRGTSLLLQQLLPPLDGYTSPSAGLRWRQRLDTGEPVFVDYARHGPGDPVWRERAIDGSTIVVPTLCVGGWRDAFLDGLVDAYERIAGPKQLIVGPWGHVLPQDSAFAPIDFLPLALRWWERWLGGRPVDAPASPVIVYVGGDQPHWRGYAQWPPPGEPVQLVTRRDTMLLPTDADAPPGDGQAIGRHRPDAGVGALRGLPGLGFGELTPPQDQHEDDTRSLCATSLPLSEPLVIGGRPRVRLRLGAGHGVQRLVVRVCAVDGDDRSALLTLGVVSDPGVGTQHEVLLRPLLHRVEAGHRLRVAVGDADFPRLNPLSEPTAFDVFGIDLELPVVPANAGRPVDLPVADRDVATPHVHWSVERDCRTDEVRVGFRVASAEQSHVEGHRYDIDSELHAAVSPGLPAAAEASGRHSARLRMSTGEQISASATVRCTQTELWAHGEVVVDGVAVYARSWQFGLGSAAGPAEAASADDPESTGPATTGQPPTGSSAIQGSSGRSTRQSVAGPC